MSGTKATSVRLSKAAKECNISVQRAAEYLAEKGIEIDARPNTKLESNAYDLLLDKFQPDLKIKRQSEETTIEQSSRESVAIDYIVEKAAAREEKQAEKEKAKAEVATAKPPVAETPVVEEKADPVVEAPVVAKAPEPVKVEEPAIETPKVVEKPTEEPVVQAKETPKAEDKPVEKPAEEPKQEVIAEEKPKEENSGKLKVLGTVDLKQFDKKPKKKQEYQKPAAKPAAPAPKVEAPKAPVKPEPPKEEPRKIEVKEHHETKVEKLQGVKVLGKIELPVDKRPSKKQPIASSDDPSGANKKRKRKRIVTPGSGTGTGTGTGTGRPGGAPGRPGGAPGRPGGVGSPNRPGGRPGGGPREPKAELTEAQIQKEIKDTLARLSGSGKSKSSKMRRAKRDAHSVRAEEQRAQDEAQEKVLEVTEFVSVGELASMMDVAPTQIISACMSLGIMATINQRLDAETLTIIAEDFGFELNFVTADDNDLLVEVEEEDPANLLPRAPIVTVMGHVDHGKTSLLDYVRRENVIAGEAGGITQHIGAYAVTLENGKVITFLDTPGHEAFTAMRARGAKVTDIAIIVIAADDAVMPQTREAINHAQAAQVPMIFAINKMDKDGAQPEKIKEQLAGMNILVEDWGGKYQCQEISAKKGLNIDVLLEKVLLEAELLELKANPNKKAVGTVIEASLDKGRGYVTTMLVESGTIKLGDVVLAGTEHGKVKAMFNERGTKIKEAGPATPITILGLNGAVSAGDRFNVMAEEREAKEIANKRQQLVREQGMRSQKHITLDEIGRRLALGDFKELNVILKGDVDGSIEALSDALVKLSTENIQVNIIHKAVGPITESDVLLASASDAIIIGFQVRPVSTAKKLAEQEEIDIRLYSIIYDAIDELKLAMEGMLDPDIEEVVIGTAEVRETFKITKVGTIAGCFITDGKIIRGNKIRLIREGIVVHSGELSALKRFKDDVKEVGKGYECGISIVNFHDIKERDVIESYEEKEVKKKL